MADADLAEFPQVVDAFNIHDALVVGSHRARRTEAVVTADRVIREAGVPTIWS